MQIKTFDIHAPEKEINEFLDTHAILKNGVNILENNIVIMWAEKLTPKEAMILKLKTTLEVFQDQYVEATINRDFYLKLELAGKGGMELTKEVQTPMGPQQMKSTVTRECQTAKATLESVKAQIVVILAAIKNPPELEDEPTIYGKKQYKNKDEEA